MKKIKHITTVNISPFRSYKSNGNINDKHNRITTKVKKFIALHDYYYAIHPCTMQYHKHEANWLKDYPLPGICKGYTYEYRKYRYQKLIKISQTLKGEKIIIERTRKL